MKRKIITTILTAAFVTSMSITAFADQWKLDTTGWWYQKDNGSYLSNGWNWIDGKCYYFTPEGYCLINTTTPDGYTVDASGAWTVDGVVQIKTVEVQTTTETQSASQVPNVEGTYVGSGITCEIFNEGNNNFWVESSLEKDYLPQYIGDGVFASPYTRYSFSGNTLIIDDLYGGQTYQLVKQ